MQITTVTVYVYLMTDPCKGLFSAMSHTINFKGSCRQSGWGRGISTQLSLQCMF